MDLKLKCTVYLHWNSFKAQRCRCVTDDAERGHFDLMPLAELGDDQILICGNVFFVLLFFFLSRRSSYELKSNAGQVSDL